MRRVLGFFGVVLMLLSGTLAYARRDEPEQWIAFISNRDGNAEIYRMRPDGSDVQQLTHTNDDIVHCWIKWSPRGDWLFYGRDYLNMNYGGPFGCYSRGDPEHYAIRISGTRDHRTILECARSLSPNGRWCILSEGQQGTNLLYRARPDGSQRLFLGEAIYSSWSRDSKWVAVWWEYATEIRIIGLDGQETRTIDLSDYGFAAVGSLVFDPLGDGILFYGVSESEENSSDGFYLLNLTTRNLHLFSHAPVGIGCPEQYNSEPLFSPDYQWLACLWAGLSVFDMTNGQGIEVSDFGPIAHPNGNGTGKFSWSPDSQWIVFSKFDEAGRSKIWRIHPDGTGLEQLTFGPGEDLRPAWSPN